MKLSLCVLFFAPLLAYAQSSDGSVLSPLNAELPKGIHFSGEYRVRGEAYQGGSYTPYNNQGYLLSRFQLNLDARYSWFRLYAQTEDSRVLGDNAIPDAFPYQDSFDLRQAFVELGKGEKGRFYVRAGRQELAFGEQRILGVANWLNTPRSFDAVRAGMNFHNLRVDAFSATFVNVKDGTFDHSKGGSDLHGLYGTLSNALPGATIEPYLFWHLGGGFKTEAGAPAKRNVKMAALRVARKPGNRVDYVVHLLRQFGTLGNDSISAYAMNFDLGYTWRDVPLHPRVFGDYAYASGDNNAHDNKINTFDQMYPSNHGLYGIVDLFGWQNLRDTKGGFELKPVKNLQVAAITHSLYLANSHDGLYNGTGALVVRKADGSAGSHLGQELEGTSSYAFTKYLTAGVGVGHLFPGEFVKKATKASSYNISYLMLVYTF